MRLTRLVPFVFLMLPGACASGADEGTGRAGDGVGKGASGRPAMAWDHHPEAADWTAAGLAFLTGSDAGIALVRQVPADIARWCPAYPRNAPPERAAFWVGLLAALAGHESTWNPQAVGGGGRWFGLVQISPATARGYGCAATSGAELQEGRANITCALRIIGRTVARDGVVAAGGGGVAADWGPFLHADKRAQMRAWISRQSYCRQE